MPSMLARVSVFAVLMLALVGAASPAAADRFTVVLDESVADDTAAVESGRVILFFITEQGPRWQRTRPIDGPFWSAPQPIASMPVTNFEPGDAVTFAETASYFPVPPHELTGRVRVQALLDHDDTTRTHLALGNYFSAIIDVELQAGTENEVRLVLDQRIEPHEPVADQSNLVYVEYRSELLSEFYGRDVHHRAGVALPRGFLEDEGETTRWPAIYRVPGFGGTHAGAAEWAHVLMHTTPLDMPQAVVIVLDPDSHLGHHGFVDNDNHGPRGTALVKELIPHLESKFRLKPDKTARIITGHSSGGWSSLWLQLQWPDVFGACWSSAPDPVDFSAFQMTNIYEDESMFIMENGSETPSYHRMGRDGTFQVLMTVREEVGMEYAMHPYGGSGQQWDTWRAMFSPPNPQTEHPNLMFDSSTGKIDRDVAEHWKKFDIARLLRDDWERYGPIMLDQVRLACGLHDDYYLHRAVKRLKQIVDEKKSEEDADRPGYIWLIEFGTHGNIHNFTTPRWHTEMIEFFNADND